MACKEVAALRLGMMSLLGIEDEAERVHELNEIGTEATEPGVLKALIEARDWKALGAHFEASLAELEARVAKTAPDDPKLGYLRALLVFTRKIELDLARLRGNLEGFYQDLDEMHDYLHELYPA